MAALRRLADGAILPVPGRCLLGRVAQSTIRLDDRYASSEHAAIRWTGWRWELRDLGSKNGTFVDGERLEPGKPRVLARGSRIGFGEPGPGWELTDDGPPRAIAIELDAGTVHDAIGEILTLPDDGAPELSVYPGPTGGWVAEDAEGRTRPVRDGEILQAGGRGFRVELPSIVEATPMLETSLGLDTATLRFAVSRDEEVVQISVVSPRGTIELEPRWFGYFLLTLARARKEDSALPPADRGWRDVEHLTRALRIDPSALNVATHKARQQLAETGLEGAARVVEVRRGQRRLGTDRLELRTLGE